MEVKINRRQKGKTEDLRKQGLLPDKKPIGTKVCGGPLYHRNISEAMREVNLPEMECIWCGRILRTNDDTCKNLI